jgi:hypothetical protein
MERFEPGDLLVIIGSDGSGVTFCRHDEYTELSERDQFTPNEREFKQRIETV